MTIKDIKFDYPLGSKFEKLGGNLYKITTDWAVIVRFHNTDIVKKEGGKIILKCTYYNRTWESFKYESLLQKLLANAKKNKAINEEEEQDFKKMIENGGEKEKNEFGFLKMFSALNKIENNDLKKRNECDIKMLKATMGEGLDIPANWDDLEEETKRERLDKIMSAI
jgi:hypothetical protein